VQARSALFDVYGDHLRRRGGTAPVAALIRLLAAVDIAAPAVRTAVSRMVRQDWLEPVPTGDGPGYALTERAARRLDDAYARIYRTGPHGWDGQWHVVVADRPDGRSARERLASGLAYLGYGPLGAGTWVAPRAHPEVPAVLGAEGVRAETFHAAYDGAGGTLARRAWDLAAVAAAYERFEWAAAELLEAAPADTDPDRAAFSTRSRLVHEWRKFLFVDPALPPEVLPDDWPGARAALMFDAAATGLWPAASRYVDECLAATGRADGAGRLAQRTGG
jgi:phenylacetic acid degradation operon negative regulatory protein